MRDALFRTNSAQTKSSSRPSPHGVIQSRVPPEDEEQQAMPDLGRRNGYWRGDHRIAKVSPVSPLTIVP